jgi:hypothetical protein
VRQSLQHFRPMFPIWAASPRCGIGA